MTYNPIKYLRKGDPVGFYSGEGKKREFCLATFERIDGNIAIVNFQDRKFALHKDSLLPPL